MFRGQDAAWGLKILTSKKNGKSGNPRVYWPWYRWFVSSVICSVSILVLKFPSSVFWCFWCFFANYSRCSQHLRLRGDDWLLCTMWGHLFHRQESWCLILRFSVEALAIGDDGGFCPVILGFNFSRINVSLFSKTSVRLIGWCSAWQKR